MEDGVGLVLFLGILVIGGIIALACYCEKKKKENFLKSKLSNLGNLTNYTYSQLVSYIGGPSGIQYIDGGKICTWQECETSGWSWGVTGIYTITLIFDANDRCVGISSETYF